MLEPLVEKWPPPRELEFSFDDPVLFKTGVSLEPLSVMWACDNNNPETAHIAQLSKAMSVELLVRDSSDEPLGGAIHT
jgi:hypothetical protein